jgi:ABC-type transport system involved in multi-copper enzyme maturation permease subunit
MRPAPPEGRCQVAPAPEALRWGRQTAIVARYAVLEGVRTHLLWTVAGSLLILCFASLVIDQLAITESTRVRLTFLGAGCRLAVMAILCQHVVASVVREFNDEAVQLVLALPLRRSAFYTGKLLGYCSLALLVVLMAGTMLAPFSHWQLLIPWLAMLYAEAALMTGIALFCAMGTRQMLFGTLLAAAFYATARSIATIGQLAAARLAAQSEGMFALVSSAAVQLLSFALPDLSRFARTDWLVDGGATPGDLVAATLQTTVYVLLVSSAGIHDLNRRNF